MVTSITRRIYRSVVLSKPTPSHLFMSLCTRSNGFAPNLDDADPNSAPFSPQQRTASGVELDNGVDNGIYRAILVGQVGQRPLQKTLKNGRRFAFFPVGTGGMGNSRTPLMHQDPNPKEYANRPSVQWHRVSIYQESLADMAMKHVLPGSIVYLEGNLETRVYNDQMTGLARRVREIAIHRDGRIVFLGKGEDNQLPTPGQLQGVGYY